MFDNFIQFLYISYLHEGHSKYVTIVLRSLKLEVVIF